MLRKLLNFIKSKFEDPKRPLLGPNINYMKLFGFILPKNFLGRYIWLALHIQIFFFVLSQFMELFIMLYQSKNLAKILNNLRCSIVGSVNVFKLASFFIWRKSYSEIFDYITRSDIEARERNNEADNKDIKEYTSYCHRVTYTYWSFTIVTATMITVPIFLRYVILIHVQNDVDYATFEFILSHWMPLDKSSKIGKYENILNIA